MTDDRPAAHYTNRIEWTPVIVAGVIYAALSMWLAVASRGFLEADGITHYLARRFALGEPLHLVGVWSRPLCVALYAIPAHLGGLVGVRWMSLLLVLVMTGVTLAVARQTRIGRPALAAVFLLTQPLLFAHSFSELTEITFALLLIVGFWFYQRKWLAALAIVAAICPLARPEGFGLLAVVAFTLIAHKKPWWLAILPLGLMAWTYAGWWSFGGPTDYAWYQWLGRNWPYSGESMYGSGSPVWFLMVLPVIVGPVAFPAVGFGCYAIVHFGTFGGSFGEKLWAAWKLFWQDHAYRCRLLLAVIPVGVLLGHSMLWTFGRMASSGEPRYLLIVAPFWALLAAAGWQGVVRRLRLRRPYLPLAVGALLPLAINFAYPTFPLRAQAEDRLAEDVRGWMAGHPELRRDYPLLSGALPHLFMQLDIDRLDYKHVVDSSRTNVRHPTDGTVMVWDTIYSTHNSSAEYCIDADLLTDNGWTAVAEFEREGKRVVVYLSPKTVNGEPAPRSSVLR